MELRAVVHSETTGKAGYRPRQIDFKLTQPGGLVEDAVKQAEAYRRSLRRIERQRESGHHSGEHVDAERQPGPSDKLAGLFIHHDDIHLCVIDLNEIERLFDLQGKHQDLGGVTQRRPERW